MPSPQLSLSISFWFSSSTDNTALFFNYHLVDGHWQAFLFKLYDQTLLLFLCDSSLPFLSSRNSPVLLRVKWITEHWCRPCICRPWPAPLTHFFINSAFPRVCSPPAFVEIWRVCESDLLLQRINFPPLCFSVAPTRFLPSNVQGRSNDGALFCPNAVIFPFVIHPHPVEYSYLVPILTGLSESIQSPPPPLSLSSLDEPQTGYNHLR